MRAVPARVMAKLLLALGLAMMVCAGAAHATIGAMVNELMQNQRRLLAMAEVSASDLRGESRRAGHYLFVRNQHLIRELAHEVRSGTTGTVAARYQEFTTAAEAAVHHEGDQLALRAPLQALLQGGFLPDSAREDVQRRLTAIGAIRRRFGADVPEGLPLPGASAGKVVRPLWDAYVHAVVKDTPPERVIAQLDGEIFGAFPDSADYSEAAARARFLEWDGTELPERSVLLTFDDGPHATNTPRVLDILQAHGVHAIFFMVGRNLGALVGGAILPGTNADLVRRMVAEGHAVGNHSYSHPLLPKLDNPRLKREVEDTQRLIEALVPAGAARSGTLRPPFGARNDRVLAEIDSHRLRSVMWNIDSLDWADPIPESIVQRVLREVDKEKGGIILMHDVQARAVDALPRIIAALKQRGYTFLKWDGKRLVGDAQGMTEGKKTP